MKAAWLIDVTLRNQTVSVDFGVGAHPVLSSNQRNENVVVSDSKALVFLIVSL